MKQRARAKTLRISTRILVAVILGAMSSVSGCSRANSNQAERDFTTLDLLIPIERMPPGWEISGEPRPMSSGEGGPDDSQVQFKPLTEKYNLARHWVWQYNDTEEASKGFERQFLRWFNSNSIAIDRPWREPDGWSYSSPDANEFHVACTINNVVTTKEVCQAIWQYDEFVIVFGSVIRQELMTMEQFESVVREIDRIMASYLRGKHSDIPYYVNGHEPS